MRLARRLAASAFATAAALTLAAGAAGHELDHPAPAFVPNAVVGTALNAGGAGASWELLTTFATGTPHTDLDFFTQRGETYAAVGTLAAGANAAGQTIFRLTESGKISKTTPKYVSAHPSATCISDPSLALSLQHDVEATPKGDVIFSTVNPVANRDDAQLLLDATDASGRCHDQGTLGVSGAPRGGLEIIDITDVERPIAVGLTSHIGEAHTVNVDPKRPHIAITATSDSVNVTCNADDTQCTRANENPTSSQRFRLDGFELVDLSSCMNFSPLTSVDTKRWLCRPNVYRYRYPSALVALGHTLDTLGACHEVEIYPDDRLTCASIAATIVFDLSGAFDDNGTPNDYTDDKPRGTPLPCRVRPSSSAGPFATGAMVTDCVSDETGGELTIPRWLSLGAPSLAGVEHVGTVFHQGRAATGSLAPYDSTQDVDVSHEAEITGSGDFMLVTDERGGGVAPPGATCVTSPADNLYGNGGIHAYRLDKLLKASPATAAEAWVSYARTPAGDKAVYRAPVRTGPQADMCTSHVFHQIPGQNRIFMGWYTQGTQVVDFVEHADGTVEFKSAGWFIPENANTWTSAIFKMGRNSDGTFTYWGATADFNLGTAGRSAVDIYKVTLPAPPAPPAPDLAVSPADITVTPNGDSATITATIRNVGTRDASNVRVRFADNGVTIGSDQVITTVAAGGSGQASVSWSTKHLKGDRVITVVVDPAPGTVAESDETNNTASKTVTVRGNKVRNGSFESAANGSSPDAWSSSGSTSYGSGGTDGERSVTVGVGGSWTSEPVPVTAGSSYTFSVDATGAAATVLVEQLSATGAVLATTTRASSELPTFAAVTATLTPVEAATAVRVKLVGGLGTTRFDDVRLWED